LVLAGGLLESFGHICPSALDLPEEAGPLAGVTDVAVAETGDAEQHRVLVAVLQDAPHLQPIARGFPFCPELASASAEERGESSRACDGQRLFVHEADHQHFAATVVLNNRWYQAVEL